MTPTPDQIREARQRAGLSQTAAAALIYFVGDNADDHMGSVFVYRIGELSIDEWVSEAKQRYIENQ
jgi:hypothetical protein